MGNIPTAGASKEDIKSFCLMQGFLDAKVGITSGSDINIVTDISKGVKLTVPTVYDEKTNLPIPPSDTIPGVNVLDSNSNTIVNTSNMNMFLLLVFIYFLVSMYMIISYRNAMIPPSYVKPPA